MDSKIRYAPLLWALFALLTCAYLLAYSGTLESGDSRSLFNLTASLYRFGDTRMDLNADQQRPVLPLSHPNSDYPLRDLEVEPLHSLAALPLYAIADVVPGIGLAHTTWLFNILVTAATACMVYVFGRTLGYAERSSLAVALAFGLCTAALPYSKSFFREPLSALTVLTSFLAADKARASHYRPVWVVLLAASVAIMLATRASSVFALPALVILLLPSIRLRRDGLLSRKAMIAVILAVLAAVVIFVLGNALGGTRYNILARLSIDRNYVETALHSYLLSVGGSIWGTSPVLLLAIPGCVLLWRRRQWQHALVPPLLIFAYTFGYANFTDSHWFGGLSWPPRFLIATIPVLILGTLPVVSLAIDPTARKRERALALIGFLLLCGYGLWIQLTAVSMRWEDYVLGLPSEALGTVEWLPGLNQIEYLRWVIIPQLWGRIPLDLAWVRADVPLWAAAGGLILAVCTYWLGWGIWKARRAGRLTAALGATLLIFAFVGLRLFHDRDPYYRAGDSALHTLVTTLANETHDGDVALLSNPAYVSFFMNYGKLHDAARIISLPDHPGDRPSLEQPPRIESANPEILVLKESIPLIHALANTRDHLYLIENFGPALTWSVRPVERFLAAYYYPIRTIELSPQVRLIEFDTTPAPDPFGFYAPQYTSSFAFGESIRLLGYDLPGGETYRPGDTVPLSLYWEGAQAMDGDYVVGVYLRAADGSAIAQQDAMPAWGFAPTSRWQAGDALWDNRALRLPIGIPLGEYQLWLKVYGFNEDFSALDLPASGGEVREGVIAVLEPRIIVGGP